jgi:zona occludens toxin (predicted ATPase)
MITIVQGAPGSGKTYWAARFILHRLAAGDHVYTNVPIKSDALGEYIRDRMGLDVDLNVSLHLIPDEQVRNLHGIVGAGEGINTQVIIDESHMQLNARDFAQQARALMNWASVSRHYRADLIFISQHRHNIDAQLRRLANRYLFLRDFQMMEFSGVKFNWLPYFRATVVDIDERTVLAREWIRKDKGIYSVYDSYSMAVGEAAAVLTSTAITKVKKKVAA